MGFLWRKLIRLLRMRKELKARARIR